MTTWTVRPPERDDELAKLLDVMSEAFAFPRDRADMYAELASATRIISRDRDRALGGGLAILDFGQFFGGRSVRSAGIAAVGVAPEYRGGGVATALMVESMRQLRDEGFSLSSLYPAVLPLYRRAGYELAGLTWTTTLDLGRTMPIDRQLETRRITESSRPTVEALYSAWADRTNGMVDRIPFNWSAIEQPRGKTSMGFVVERAGKPEGYVYCRQDLDGPEGRQLMILDLVARSADAARRLLAFIRDQHSILPQATCRLPASSPIFALLDHQGWTCRLHEHWMLRILDVERAVTDRGYRASIDAELHIAVHDDVIEANESRFIVHVGNGRATIEHGGRGDLELDVRALAPLYSGLLRVDDLILTGAAKAHHERAYIADDVFHDGTPWMVDRF